jgi:class 3 adenylate cyclase
MPMSDQSDRARGQAPQRKLTTILSADVASYSRLMAEDEEHTLKIFAGHREVFEGLVALSRGRIFNTAGDAILAEFPSAVDAVRCATEIQAALRTRDEQVAPEKRVRFRIGLNLGDVMVQGTDLLGDGVNVAARLQSAAEPGGICISGSVYDQIINKLSLSFLSMGEMSYKNIPQPVRTFCIVEAPGHRPLPTPSVAAPAAAPAIAPAKSGRRHLWLGAAAAAVIVIAGIGGYWVYATIDAERAELAKERRLARQEEIDRQARALAEAQKAAEAKEAAEHEAAVEAQHRAELAETAERAAKAEAARAEAEAARIKLEAEEDRAKADAVRRGSAQTQDQAEPKPPPPKPPKPLPPTETASAAPDERVADAVPPPVAAPPGHSHEGMRPMGDAAGGGRAAAASPLPSNPMRLGGPDAATPPAAKPAGSPPSQVAAAVPTPARPGQSADRFNGSWLTMINCSAFGRLQGFRITLDGKISGGQYQGQRGTPGEPGSLNLTGEIGTDGKFTLHALGRTSDTAFSGLPSNTTYGYDLVGQISDRSGTGTRTIGRPCTVDLNRE